MIRTTAHARTVPKDCWYEQEEKRARDPWPRRFLLLLVPLLSFSARISNLELLFNFRLLLVLPCVALRCLVARFVASFLTSLSFLWDGRGHQLGAPQQAGRSRPCINYQAYSAESTEREMRERQDRMESGERAPKGKERTRVLVSALEEARGIRNRNKRAEIDLVYKYDFGSLCMVFGAKPGSDSQQSNRVGQSRVEQSRASEDSTEVPDSRAAVLGYKLVFSFSFSFGWVSFRSASGRVGFQRQFRCPSSSGFGTSLVRQREGGATKKTGDRRQKTEGETVGDRSWKIGS